MQKVVSITVAVTKMKTPTKDYVYTDYEELNKLLEEGYVVQSHFISNPTGDVTWPTVMFILAK